MSSPINKSDEQYESVREKFIQFETKIKNLKPVISSTGSKFVHLDKDSKISFKMRDLLNELNLLVKDANTQITFFYKNPSFVKRVKSIRLEKLKAEVIEKLSKLDIEGNQELEKASLWLKICTLFS